MKYSEEDPIVILLPGPRLRPEEVRGFEELVEQHIKSGNVHLVLDMSHVEWMDSSLLGILVAIHRKIQEHQGRLVMCQFHECVLCLFRVMGREELFAIRNTVDEALGEFDEE